MRVLSFDSPSCSTQSKHAGCTLQPRVPTNRANVDNARAGAGPPAAGLALFVRDLPHAGRSCCFAACADLQCASSWRRMRPMGPP